MKKMPLSLLLLFCLCFLFASPFWAYASSAGDVATPSNATPSNGLLQPRTLDMSRSAELPETVTYRKFFRTASNTVVWSDSNSMSGNYNLIGSSFSFGGAMDVSFCVKWTFTSTAPVSYVTLGTNLDGTYVNSRLPSSCIVRSGNNYVVTILFRTLEPLYNFEIYAELGDYQNVTCNFGSMEKTVNYFSSVNYATCSGIYKRDGNKCIISSMSYFIMSNGNLESLGWTRNNSITIGKRLSTLKNIYFYISDADRTSMYYGGYQYTAYFDLYGLGTIRNIKMFGGTTYYNVDNWTFDNSGRLVVTFTPLYDISIQDLRYYLEFENENASKLMKIRLVNVMSSYIPPGNTQDQQQNISSNTTIIKNTVTTISNTITNIQNTLTFGLSTIGNNITSTAKETQQTIKDTTKQTVDKLNDVKTGIQNKLEDTAKKTQEKLEDVKKGMVDKLEDTKKGIIDGILEGLKKLFIPSEDYFEKTFADLKAYTEERLGILTYPFTLIEQLITMITSTSADGVIKIPSIDVPLPNTTIHLTDATSFRFQEQLSSFGFLFDTLRFLINVMILGSFLKLCYEKYSKIIEGG